MGKYIEIRLVGGDSYVQPMDELHNAIDGELDGLETGESITLSFTPVEMSEDEYEKLPEFAGH